MIDDFARPAWAETHEKFATDVAAGLARFAPWLGRARADGETAAVTPTPMSRPATMVIAAEPATSPVVQYCLGEYYRELGERFDGGFDPELSLLPSLDEFAPPRGVFLVARLDGEPVGCGGLKPLSADAAYLKRMWVAPRARGLGLSRRLLGELEAHARRSGYSVVRLETNKTLVEAQQLYRSSGYREVPPFNDERYAHHWFEKALHPGRARQPQIGE
jgi:GNAT superfamily N-acetyltransferase